MYWEPDDIPPRFEPYPVTICHIFVLCFKRLGATASRQCRMIFAGEAFGVRKQACALILGGFIERQQAAALRRRSQDVMYSMWEATGAGVLCATQQKLKYF
jgi:hypothetical protein